MLREHARAGDLAARSLDVACLAGAFVLADRFSRSLATIIPHIRPLTEPAGYIFRSPQYLWFFAISLFAWWVASQYGLTYRSHRGEPLVATASDYLKTVVSWILATSFLSYFLHFLALSRIYLFTFFALSTLLICVKQLLVTLTLGQLRRRGFNSRSAIVVGREGPAQRFASILASAASAGYRTAVVNIDGSYIGQDRLTNGNGHNNGVKASDALGESRISQADEIFIVASGAPEEQVRAVTGRLLNQGHRVHIVPALIDATLFRHGLAELAGIPVLSIGGFGVDPVQSGLKRCVDLLVAGFAIVILSPLMGLVGLAVKLTSAGPMIFAQERIGRNGERFRVLKFRTMYANAERILQSNPALYREYVVNNYKLPKDREFRVTPLGRLLRVTSLDELPQLVNVLRGEMSLVGPRPIVPEEIEKYGDYARLYLSVKPGLTGHWQVNGRSEVKDYSIRAQMDIEYLRDQSFRTDIDILLRTIPAVLRRRGSY